VESSTAQGGLPMSITLKQGTSTSTLPLPPILLHAFAFSFSPWSLTPATLDKTAPLVKQEIKRGQRKENQTEGSTRGPKVLAWKGQQGAPIVTSQVLQIHHSSWRSGISPPDHSPGQVKRVLCRHRLGSIRSICELIKTKALLPSNKRAKLDHVSHGFL
jgi:hypothetical protein